ncbi:hypothetical protein I7I48_02472 [Histoplasma ohiense]|nr:hypothetical protein I7I48_02472 [Histoplasma ohiense (nom. inval.)]
MSEKRSRELSASQFRLILVLFSHEIKLSIYIMGEKLGILKTLRQVGGLLM